LAGSPSAQRRIHKRVRFTRFRAAAEIVASVRRGDHDGLRLPDLRGVNPIEFNRAANCSYRCIDRALTFASHGARFAELVFLILCRSPA